MVDDPLIGITEAARRIGINHSTLSRQIKSGQVRSHDGKVRLSEVLEDRANNIDASIWDARRRNAEPDVHAPSSPVHAPDDADYGPEPDDDAGTVLVDGVALPIAKAKALKETYLARLRKLEFDEKSGVLVSGETVEKLAFEWERQTRDYWANWPSQAGPIMAPELGVDQVKLVIILEQAVRRHLEERAVTALRLASQG